MMRKLTLTLALVLFTAVAVKAQTITRTMFPSVGDTIAYYSDTTTQVLSPGPAGTGQTWTFSGLVQDQLIPNIYQSPAGTPFASAFAGSNLAVEADGFYLYFNKTTDTLFYLGAGGTLLGVTLPLVNSEPMIEGAHGSNLGSSYSSTSFISATVPSSIINAQLISLGIDSLRLKRYTNKVTTFDATGALIVNGESYPSTLREKSIEYYTDSIFSRKNGNWMPGIDLSPFGPVIGSETKDTAYVYRWFEDGTKGHLMSLSVDAEDSTNSVLFRVAMDPCAGVVVNTGPITGPNSAQQGSQQVYNVTGQANSTFAWSVTGGTIVSGNGTNQVTVQWGSGTGGTLSVTETTNDGCDGQPVNLAVTLTTPSSIANDLATSTVIFPNPTHSSDLTVRTTLADAGSLTLRIVDLSGRAVLSQTHTATPGLFQATLPTATLPAGLYFVELRLANGAAYTTKVIIGQ